MNSAFLKLPWKWISLASILFLIAIVPIEAKLTHQPQANMEINEELDLEAIQLPEGYRISLKELTQLAIAQHLGIQINRLDYERVQQDERIEKGNFDTNFSVGGEYYQNKQQRSSIVLGSREVEGKAWASLSKKLATGTKVTTEYTGQRNSTDTSFSSLNPSYSGSWSWEIEQPFLKNAFGFIDRKRLEKVRVRIKKLNYDQMIRIERSLYELRLDYWDLVEAERRFLIQKRALEVAKKFLESTVSKLDVGLSERPDILAAEANVRQRLIDLERAKIDFEILSNQLLLRLNLSSSDTLYGVIVARPDEEESELEDNFLEKHWEYRQALLGVEETHVAYQIARNEALPDLSVNARYASTSLDRDLGASQGEIFGFNHPQYTLGVSLETPLERRVERGQEEQARIDVQRAETELLEVKRDLEQRWHQMSLTLQMTHYEMRQASKIHELQEEKLEEEMKHFFRGRSDSKTIIDYQDDVVEAELRKSSAWVLHEKALDARLYLLNQLLQDVEIVELGDGEA